MALPQVDPSLPGGAAPVFGDTDAARGDHLRANNQAIWENLEYLNDGENVDDAAAATPVDADKVGFFQIVGAVIKYVTFANLFAYIVSKLIAVTTKTTPVDADAVLLRDSEASDAPKWVTLTNLKSFLNVYFATIFQPLNTVFESSELTYATNTVVSATHSLGAVPKRFQAVLRCKTAELGHSIGDEIDVTSHYMTGPTGQPLFGATVNATTIYFSAYSGVVNHVVDRGGSTGAPITPGSWRVVLRAWKY